MEIQKYKYLIGKSRKEIIAELGEEFNDYHSTRWSYALKRDWWGRWVMLVLVFEGDKVDAVRLEKHFYIKSVNHDS
jgi:hypothetical protein